MEYSFIGKDIVRKEAWEKVTGQTKYNADIGSPANLYAVLVTSTCAHGNIENIDTALASVMPGVKTILTGVDYPALTGSLLEDRPRIHLWWAEPLAAKPLWSWNSWR